MTNRDLKNGRACVVCLIAILIAAPEAHSHQAGRNNGASAASRGWECKLCPAPRGWSGAVDLGAGWTSDSSPKFADYRGLDEQGLFPALDGVANYRGKQGSFVDMRADDLGIDRRSVHVRGGVRGKYLLDLTYREIPKYRGYGTETVYTGVGGNELGLPAGWVPAGSTNDMTALGEALRPVELKTSRRSVELGLRGRLTTRWSYDLRLQHQRKEGTRPFGAGVFTINSSHLPVPVDFSTGRIDAGLSYSGNTASWRLGLSGSDFANGNHSVTWQNPFAAISGTGILRASLEPDNRFHQLQFNASWSAARRLRLTGSMALGRVEQDDPLLPASINPNFSNVPVPRDSAEARVKTGMLNFGGTAEVKLGRQLTFTARLRHDERENRTPIDFFVPIITDIVPRDPRPNRPYSFERNRASLAMRFRPHPAARFQFGTSFEEFERSLQPVDKTEDFGLWGQLTLHPASWMNLRARLERSDRNAGTYVPIDEGSLVKHPLMRKFNLADRERERVKIDLDFFPLPGLTVTTSYARRQDSYDRSVLGLTSSEDRSFTLDFSMNAAESLVVHAFFSRDEIDSVSFGASSAASAPWSGTTRDTFLSAGLGFQFGLSERAGIHFDIRHADSEGAIQVVSRGSSQPFPTLATRLWNAHLRLDYQVTDRWGLKASIEFESYDSTDWALDGIGPDGIPSILGFGQESPDYRIALLRLQASYLF
jgi:MtrB/PioB family decaheme-associated outer membrane protein